MSTPKTMQVSYELTITIGDKVRRISATGTRCKTFVSGLKRAKKDISSSINDMIHAEENTEE